MLISVLGGKLGPASRTLSSKCNCWRERVSASRKCWAGWWREEEEEER